VRCYIRYTVAAASGFNSRHVHYGRFDSGSMIEGMVATRGGSSPRSGTGSQRSSSQHCRAGGRPATPPTATRRRIPKKGNPRWKLYTSVMRTKKAREMLPLISRAHILTSREKLLLSQKVSGSLNFVSRMALLYILYIISQPLRMYRRRRGLSKDYRKEPT
jgi:hypothetical protein